MIRSISYVVTIIFFIGCQNAPTPIEEKKTVENVEEFEPITVVAPPQKKKVIKKVIVEPVVFDHPNTISSCPDGVAGKTMSSFTNNGRYCYSREKSMGCHREKDQEVTLKAQRHCTEVVRKRHSMGLSKSIPVEVGRIKRDSCSCGWYRGKEICKSYFKFVCRES